MTTIALRFAETFAPDEGTIHMHQKIIDQFGFVWYGKLGLPISKKIQALILQEKAPRILLIHSGKTNRYWAYIDMIQNETPDLMFVPSYYGAMAEKMKTWFRVTKINTAEKNVMSNCWVKSSGVSLSSVSRHSISPYFIIEYNTEGGNCK